MSTEVNVHRAFVVCANTKGLQPRTYPLYMHEKLCQCMNINDVWYVNMIIYNYTWYCMQLNMLWFQRAGRKEYIIMIR